MTEEKQPRRLRRLDVVVGVVIAVLLIARFGPEIRARTGLPMTAPALEIATLEGDTVRLAGLRGDVVLINFWATWCAPCLTEMPAIQRVWEDYRDRGLHVIGLSVDAGPVVDFVTRIRDDGVSYPLALAPGGAQRALGHGGTLPTTIVIDPEGRIREYEDRALSEAELRDLVRPYLPR